MKTKKIDKKLSINKSTVTNLDNVSMDDAKAGKITVTFMTCDYSLCGTGATIEPCLCDTVLC